MVAKVFSANRPLPSGRDNNFTVSINGGAGCDGTDVGFTNKDDCRDVRKRTKYVPYLTLNESTGSHNLLPIRKEQYITTLSSM